MRGSLAARILRWVLVILAVGGVFVTCAPGFSGNTWWIRYLDFPRIEFFSAMLVVGFLLLILPKTKLSIIAFCGMAATCAYDAYVLFPFTSLAGTQMVSASSCPADNRLRLLEVNVQMTNRHDNKLLNMVREVKPDVAWFQETNAWWTQELSKLSDTMPHHVEQQQPNYFGVDLYSRLPLENPQVKHLTGSANPSVFTDVRLPSGQDVKLYAIHPRPPQKGQSTAERDAQLLATALAAHGDTQPHVVAGDMNSVPWEDVIRQTKRIGGFLAPRLGRGLHISWNAKSWILKWPLDQILPGPDFTLLSLKVLPAFGSDHHPYLAVLCLDPAAGARQSPLPMQPGDLQMARKAVERGQGQANKQGYKGHGGPSG